MSGEYPRAPVPEAAATRPAKTITLIVANAIMGVPVMILGATIGADYGWSTSWLVIGLGCAITALFAAMTALAGVRSRRSAALLAQDAFGQSGAHFLNLAIAIALLGWFAVEMGFIGAMVSESTKAVIGIELGRAPGIVIASISICAVAVAGITYIGRAPLLFLPLLGALMLAVIVLTIDAMPTAPASMVAGKSVGTGISAIVGAYIVGCLIMPDYSRFVRSAKSAVGATTAALGPIYALMLGTYASAGMVTAAAQPSAILLALGIPGFIGLLLPIGLLQNGIMCLYSSALAASTFLKDASFRSIAVATMILGMSLALAGADAYFIDFLVVLGVIFPPAIVLLIGSGLRRRPTGYSSTAEWDGLGLAIWVAGILCGASSEWFGIGITGFSAFDGFIGSAVGAVAVHFARREDVTNLAT